MSSIRLSAFCVVLAAACGGGAPAPGSTSAGDLGVAGSSMTTVTAAGGTGNAASMSTAGLPATADPSSAGASNPSMTDPSSAGASNPSMTGTAGSGGATVVAATTGVVAPPMASAEDIAEAEAQRDAFHATAPEQYVVKVTTNTGRADMAAVEQGTVVAAEWRLSSMWEEAPLTNPLDYLFDWCPENASVGGCSADGCEIEAEYGYATNAVGLCPSEGALRWVSCFEAGTIDLGACRETPEPSPLQ